MKSIVSAPFKKQLLEICGSEEKLGILESLAWNHLAMEHECPSAGCNWQAFARNVLISYLPLALKRACLDFASDGQGNKARAASMGSKRAIKSKDQ
ncbi:hypothetical protein B0O99DRAFT_690723 [Bisporella sp. PMI_857]|nr:hypothetical protein B0O99DRAFT_690723 [Bisporella sp. PMI_857]